MLARLRSLLFAVNASYWFFPALFALLAGLLAIGLVHLDATGRTAWLEDFPLIDLAQPDSASNMLTVIAGSMIGVASTVFSITIAAVAYASGTYGPRLLTNFMEDRGNQLSLATFIGTFVYALMVLRSVRSAHEVPGGGQQAGELAGFVPQLSLLVAFALMLVSVAVLVFFLHHIPSSIRINSVLENIGERLLAMIRDCFPGDNRGGQVRAQAIEGAEIAASTTGYIRVIDFDRLRDLAAKHGTDVGLVVRAGDFVHPGKSLARLGSTDAGKDLVAEIRDCFALGGSRTPEQDLEFSIDELVEIALRALSPGINDPFTAITAVHWLGAATAELGNRDLSGHSRDGDEDACTVIPLEDDFDHFVGRGFGAARTALAANRLAALVTFDAILSAARVIDDESRRGLLEREAGLLLEQAEKALCGPDLEEVRARHASFGKAFAEI
ncbi:MAG: DUF2254 domain-containing protein [Novosphingobium sp.]|nr:DUF2254 domain-containing protein [Novosphingobium sp.]MCP5401455.1 DUF2254 domain-containing protein [Novosphingobium sp.]